jgi:hypothetical protein
MDASTAPALAIAALLVLAGAQKVVDPTMTVGALRALRLPGSPLLVRVGAAAEAALGAAALTVGGPVLWALVALSFLAFAAFVSAALRSGTMIGSCGCFGREETPPHWSHVALNLALAGTAGWLAAAFPGVVLDELADHPGAAVGVGITAAVAVYLLHAAFVVLPRTLADTRSTG